MKKIILILFNIKNIKMANIDIMIGGVIINVMAYVGGNYLAKYLSSDSACEEKKRHDLAVEMYEKEYQKYQEKRTKLNDYIATNDGMKDEAKENIENSDYALKLYNETRQDQKDVNEPQLSDCYKPSPNQKRGEMIYVGVSALAIGFAASHFL